ncbi:hypothetical protein AC579_4740 [Pseudocercospora musae]|uniref:non-specific serine/threonine protein kinase n=1 Tax=Pseudocercospora musae TaxID=113226 RepID=A0A139IQ74_9PEZI|nr:hypothetical protein AC579_4740 [Pseudocercospora musae]
MRQGALTEDKRASDHRSVLHKDLKPQNIFRSTHNGSDRPNVPAAKVGDFGCAVWLGSEYANEMLGTPGWFPPEEDELMAGVLFDTESAQLKFSPGQSSHNAILKPAKARQCYPEKMCELGEKCLEQLPQDRIGVNELWAEVQKVITSPVDEDGGTLKSPGRREEEV